MEKINAWTVYDEGQLAELEKLNAEYMDFLSRGKTERECAKIAVGMAEAAGYRNLDDIIAKGESLKAGDKVYAVNMAKAVILFIVGTKPIEEGMNILGAHIDSPRLDANRIRCTRNRDLRTLTRTITAVLRNTSGLHCRLQYTALLQKRTARLSMW